MTPPAKRTGKFPPHIDPDKLPDNTRFDPRGNGRWTYRKRIGKDRGKEIRIGGAELTLAEIWSTIERIEADNVPTLRGLSLKFQESDAWLELSRSTQRDYEVCHKTLCNRETRSGIKTGDMPLEAWTTGAVRRYRDARKKESASRAAHEIRYLKRLFQWGIEYEYLSGPNPAHGVSLKGLSTPRTHYVQDDDYQAAINIAPLKIALMAHLAYLTGRRRTDIVKLRRDHLEREGIFFHESKTDKASIVAWSKELRQLIELIKEESGDSLYLFTGHTGEHYRLAAMDTAWQRVRAGLSAIGNTPFQFKDIRAKHASDFDEAGGDATDNLQHSDAQVTRRHYLRKPKRVVPLR